MSHGTPFLRWIYDHSPSRFRSLMATVYSRGRSEMKFGPQFDEYQSELERIQWYSNEELRTLQTEKLARVVWHAAHFVPYYQHKFAALGLSQSGIKSSEMLALLPLLEKSVVQPQPDQFRSKLYQEPRRASLIHTSGSTGKSMQIAVSSDYLKLEKAYLWLQRSWCGVVPADRAAYFSGFPVIPGGQKKPPFWVFDATQNRMLFSLDHMRKDTLSAYAEAMVKLNPISIVGYANAVYLIALALCDANIKSVRPRGIFTSSDTLLPHQRAVMERAFGCRVMDLYGQAEYCGMIMQCERGNYHVQEDYGVVELLGRDGMPVADGEVGELICTGLNNLAMPFIRYRTGDTAVPKAGTCSCGRGGRLVERITGRLDDIIVRPDGRIICGTIDFAFDDPDIQEAQVIQEDSTFIKVRYSPAPGFSDRKKAEMLHKLHEHVGKDMRIELESVDHIPRLPNGKFRFVISKVKLGIGGAHQPGELAGVAAEEDKSL